MKIHALEIGQVKITENWMVGKETGLGRLFNTITDSRMTDWLPIYTWLIEHSEGLIIVDTGIPLDANKRVWFPPYLPLIQRKAPFKITSAQLLENQIQSLGFSPDDVRWIVQTHLHQDHDGSIGQFPNAEILISRTEWQAGQGIAGRMAGYFNWRWSELSPTLIDFAPDSDSIFAGRYPLTQAGDVYIVPTPGHSYGHQSLIIQEGDHVIFIAGDVAYTQDSLLADVVDGVGPDPAAQHNSHKRIICLAQTIPTVFLPTHDPDAGRRLQAREAISFS